MSLRKRLRVVLALLQRNATLRTVISAFNAEFERFRTDIQTVKDSLFLDTASGQSLDLISEEFGVIGRRRGRTDDSFRQFLQGLSPAFDGRGTTADVTLAVASGVTFDSDLVSLREDFSGAREYEIELLDSGWRPHRTGTTRELADIADPVAVDRVDPVYLFTEPGSVAFRAEDVESGIETEAEPGTVAINGEEAQSELIAIGLSSDDLSALSTAGFSLSTPTV